jgi:hypothetical protein
MRVRWTYVLTGTLLPVALGAPFALPHVLDRHGSAVIGTREAAPPAVPNTVVEMAALPRPAHPAEAPRALVHVTLPASVDRPSLATVGVHETTAARAVPASHWIRRHPAAPVETRAAEAPPALPTATVTPIVANLNSTDAPAQASAPVTSPVPLPALAPTPLTPVADGAWRDDHQHDQGDGHRHGHGD